MKKKGRIATAKAKTEQLEALQECARQAQIKAKQIFLEEKRLEQCKRYRREYSAETRRKISEERRRESSEERVKRHCFLNSFACSDDEYSSP